MQDVLDGRSLRADTPTRGGRDDRLLELATAVSGTSLHDTDRTRLRTDLTTPDRPALGTRQRSSISNLIDAYSGSRPSSSNPYYPAHTGTGGIASAHTPSPSSSTNPSASAPNSVAYAATAKTLAAFPLPPPRQDSPSGRYYDSVPPSPTRANTAYRSASAGRSAAGVGLGFDFSSNPVDAGRRPSLPDLSASTSGMRMSGAGGVSTSLDLRRPSLDFRRHIARPTPPSYTYGDTSPFQVSRQPSKPDMFVDTRTSGYPARERQEPSPSSSGLSPLRGHPSTDNEQSRRPSGPYSLRSESSNSTLNAAIRQAKNDASPIERQGTPQQWSQPQSGTVSVQAPYMADSSDEGRLPQDSVLPTTSVLRPGARRASGLNIEAGTASVAALGLGINTTSDSPVRKLVRKPLQQGAIRPRRDSGNTTASSHARSLSLPRTSTSTQWTTTTSGSGDEDPLRPSWLNHDPTIPQPPPLYNATAVGTSAYRGDGAAPAMEKQRSASSIPLSASMPSMSSDALRSSTSSTTSQQAAASGKRKPSFYRRKRSNTSGNVALEVGLVDANGFPMPSPPSELMKTLSPTSPPSPAPIQQPIRQPSPQPPTPRRGSSGTGIFNLGRRRSNPSLNASTSGPPTISAPLPPLPQSALQFEPQSDANPLSPPSPAPEELRTSTLSRARTWLPSFGSSKASSSTTVPSPSSKSVSSPPSSVQSTFADPFSSSPSYAPLPISKDARYANHPSRYARSGSGSTVASRSSSFTGSVHSMGAGYEHSSEDPPPPVPELPATWRDEQQQPDLHIRNGPPSSPLPPQQQPMPTSASLRKPSPQTKKSSPSARRPSTAPASPTIDVEKPTFSPSSFLPRGRRPSLALDEAFTSPTKGGRLRDGSTSFDNLRSPAAKPAPPTPSSASPAATVGNTDVGAAGVGDDVDQSKAIYAGLKLKREEAREAKFLALLEMSDSSSGGIIKKSLTPKSIKTGP